MDEIFGQIDIPLPGYGSVESGTGLLFFISNLVKLVTVAAGLFAFINLIVAGFQYVGSQGDPKNTAAAWQRIYMSLLGLIILASAITIISIISKVFFGEWDAILNPEIYGPGNF
jgi:hypothetical protein